MVAITEVDAVSDDAAMRFDPDSPVWADVTPVPQDDGPYPLCPILYDPECMCGADPDSKAMDLFRALKQMHPGGVEASERALHLTEHLVHLNPANYSIWQYRAQVLMALCAVDSGQERLRNELAFLDDFAQVNLKNYQIWYDELLHRQHRRVIVSLLGDPSRELAFTRANLEIDSKNYHTWAYRQWVLAYFGGLHAHEDKLQGPGAGAFPQLWEGECGFVDEMLERDVRNNSAYNHRWFCLFGRNAPAACDASQLEQRRLAEMDYALNKIAKAPNNVSPWNYLRGYVPFSSQTVCGA